MRWAIWRLNPTVIASLATLAISPLSAHAGGFGVREQSAEFQGMSFAGSATSGGGLSGMYWNPAVAAYAPAGLYTESHFAGIFGNVEITGQNQFLIGREDSGNIAKSAAVPASYMSYRLNERTVLAVSVNSPFGLVTEPSSRAWAGQTLARTSDIKTYNVAPTLAYRISPALAIGVGLQIQHMTGRLKSAAALSATAGNAVIQGDDTAFGLTAGVNVTPSAGTHIGLGYRSAIDHTLEGTMFLTSPPPGPFAAGIKAGVTLPETVTLSFRQALMPRWTILGTAEWMRWSRLEKLDVVCANTAPSAFCTLGNGQLARSLALGWQDGWFFSGGLEHAISDRLTLRGGAAYELSPVRAADERSLRVPDVDRLWASFGATYRYSDTVTLDLAYTHIFGVGDDTIDRREGGVHFVGTADTQIDIISASLKMQIGGAEQASLK